MAWRIGKLFGDDDQDAPVHNDVLVRVPAAGVANALLPENVGVVIKKADKWRRPEYLPKADERSRAVPGVQVHAGRRAPLGSKKNVGQMKADGVKAANDTALFVSYLVVYAFKQPQGSVFVQHHAVNKKHCGAGGKREKQAANLCRADKKWRKNKNM